MTTSFPQSVQARHAELALASYAGWNDPYDEDIRVSPAPNRGMMPETITDRYEVELHRYENGEAVFSFTDIKTDETFVVGRGTDNLLDDGLQYIPGISDGVGTELGRLMAEVAIEIYEETGQRVTVIGHSYGSHAAEEAARLAAGAMISATNFQGPSIVDLLFETPSAVSRITTGGLMNTTPLGRMDTSVPVNRVGASEYDLSGLGVVQLVLDLIGSVVNSANVVRVPVGYHDMALLNTYYNGRWHTLLFETPSDTLDSVVGGIATAHAIGLAYESEGELSLARDIREINESIKAVLAIRRYDEARERSPISQDAIDEILSETMRDRLNGNLKTPTETTSAMVTPPMTGIGRTMAGPIQMDMVSGLSFSTSTAMASRSRSSRNLRNSSMAGTGSCIALPGLARAMGCSFTMPMAAVIFPSNASMCLRNGIRQRRTTLKRCARSLTAMVMAGLTPTMWNGPISKSWSPMMMAPRRPRPSRNSAFPRST